MFSDTYGDLSNINLDPDWGQSTDSTVETLGGERVLKYAGLNYQGTAFEDNKQDVSGYGYLHFDYWSSDTDTFEFFLISDGPVEVAHSVTVEKGQWVGVDVPLSAFDGVDLTQVMQLKVVGSGTLFLDNIYFHNEVMDSVVLTEPVESAPAPAQAASDVLSLFSDAYGDLSNINFDPDWGQSTDATVETLDGERVLKYAGLNYQGTAFEDNKQDASGFTHLHFDY